MLHKKILPKEGMISFFKNIHLIDANYETIFSVNMQTNNSLMQQEQQFKQQVK